MNCTIVLSCTGCLTTEPNLHLSLLLYSCFLLCAILPTYYFLLFRFVNIKNLLTAGTITLKLSCTPQSSPVNFGDVANLAFH